MVFADLGSCWELLGPERSMSKAPSLQIVSKFKIFKHLFYSILFHFGFCVCACVLLYVYVWVCVYHGTRVEVRGQLARVLPFHHVGLGYWTKVVRLSNKHLYQLSHFIDRRIWIWLLNPTLEHYYNFSFLISALDIEDLLLNLTLPSCVGKAGLTSTLIHSLLVHTLGS